MKHLNFKVVYAMGLLTGVPLSIGRFFVLCQRAIRKTIKRSGNLNLVIGARSRVGRWINLSHRKG